MTQMLPEYTINGSFGELYENGAFMANCHKVDAKIIAEKEELKLAGGRRRAHKLKGVHGEGTIHLYKVSSVFVKRIASLLHNDRSTQFVGQLLVVLNDPEALGAERVLLKGVKMWEVDFGFEVDKIMEEAIPFTFYDIDFLADMGTDPAEVARKVVTEGNSSGK